ncbi:MAG TPA: ABC transporter substrate-binding protein [Dehalococcoidia bacterium]|jgi:peptide/nickel transport system substrate-binding protein
MADTNYWSRLTNRRISRRTLLGASATTALGGAAAMIVGCGGSSNSSSSGTATGTRAPVGSPVAGGSITEGRAVTVLGIDPHIDLTGLDIDTQVYPYLYGWIPGLEEPIFNNLAESVERPDDVTFIFHLRHGVKNAPFNFAGANDEITSEDVKASFVRRGTSVSAPDKRFPRLIGNTDTAMEAALLTPDPYTFRFSTTEVFVPALREMANPTWAIVSKKVIDAIGGRELTQVGYGAGPFMVDTFRGSERIVLKKNPNYFIAGKPYLDQQTIVVITDNSSLITAFKQGQHDVCGALLTKDDNDGFAQDSNFVTARAPSLFYPVVHMKMVPPFDDIRVREAIDVSIDRDEMLTVIQNGEGEYNGPIQWPQTKWALPEQQLKDFYKYDPERARAQLTAAGYPNGFQTKMKLPKITGISQIADIASLLKSQWAKVGINVDLEEVELGTYIGSVLLTGNFQMTFFPNLPYDEPDRPLSFYSSKGVTGSGNWNNYSNPDFDKLYNAQSKEPDETKRKQIITDAQNLIIKEHGPQLTLTGGYQYTAHWNYVHFPYEIDKDPTQTSNPFGVDTWTEKA